MQNRMKIICTNRKAGHNYEILESQEAGIVLTGTEVKSLREGRGNITESFARIEKNELFLFNAHIDEYSHGNRSNHDPCRRRKLLLHRSQINKLIGQVQCKGISLIPLKLYFVRGRVKVAVGLCKGKHEYDKREVIKKKMADREMQRVLKQRSYH